MSTIGERIKSQREYMGLTQEALAEKLGYKNKTSITKIENGINDIPQSKVVAFAKALDTSVAYLMGWSEAENKSANLAGNIFPLPKTKKVPLLGTIACGEPILATENIESYVDMDADIHADFALRCQGDSMINARIMDGDIVYIRKQDMVENGEIAAVLMDDCSESQATLKRVYISDDKIRLCAENPNYQDMIFFENDMNKVRIIGKAIAFLSTVK